MQISFRVRFHVKWRGKVREEREEYKEGGEKGEKNERKIGIERKNNR